MLLRQGQGWDGSDDRVAIEEKGQEHISPPLRSAAHQSPGEDSAK